MKNLFIVIMGMMMLLPAMCPAQVPDGSDINVAIPIYFGQTINDTIDSKTRPIQYYSITLAKGQQLSVRAKTASNYSWNIGLKAPGAKDTDNYVVGDGSSYQGSFVGSNRALDYQVAAAGTYYIEVVAYDTGITYQLQVTANGTPIATPNPTSAGCLTGQVDYITYSLQLIAASLPDEASIGGTKLCTTCTVKPPAYPQLVSKLETAMGLNVGVSACYDATGSIFQLKLIHP